MIADVIKAVLANADAFRWLFYLGVLWAFYRWMQGDDSKGIEWRDFVATKGLDGEYHGDIDKVGKTSGVVFGSAMIVQIAPNASKDFTGFALVLGTYFTFVGAVAGYSAYLRAKQGRTESVEIREPAPNPALTKFTKTTSEPAKSEPEKPSNPLESSK